MSYIPSILSYEVMDVHEVSDCNGMKFLNECIYSSIFKIFSSYLVCSLAASKVVGASCKNLIISFHLFHARER
jgi:hypothetical protein